MRSSSNRPSSRRLKLTAVLLLAVALMGGVAFSRWEPQLNEEERRLVGLWGHTEKRVYPQEFRSDRILINLATGRESAARWKIRDGQFSFTISNNTNVIPLPKVAYDVAKYVPLASRFVGLQWKQTAYYRLQWNGNDEVSLFRLSGPGGIETGKNNFTWYRIPAEK